MRTESVLAEVFPAVVDRREEVTLPCDDSGGIGHVGWNGYVPTADRDRVAAFYRERVPASGWTPRLEVDDPGSSEIHTTRHCYTADRHPGVALRVDLWGNPREPTTLVSLDLEFSSTGLDCPGE
ncbi:hypothetical protein L6E12_05035 [Actinokineospora sp. PR83]|uniref:hypothetical protein n=1 Tax=Actinokineospora sp. PR83 TaxID=2884908 RepID=UPI001F2C7698|nr:hypothetical protein [Actinokineospora sp. PR83]MCG8915155.1 hypothetical protein [Actinokineospora sp. PR83]